jgi:hypothetical protein
VATSAHNFAVVIAEELCVGAFVFAGEGRNIHHLDRSMILENSIARSARRNLSRVSFL